MRIGVVSDTHISGKEEKLPKKMLEDFKNVDMILHAGDLVDLVVIEMLKAACKNVHAVWGNMDPGDVKQKLPEKEVISAGKFKVGLFHGLGPPEGLIALTREKFKHDKVDIIVFGHAHYPTNEVKDGILFFNPGSAMDKVFASHNSYGIIDIDETIKAQVVRI